MEIGIKTKFRKIISDLPHPDSVGLINSIREKEVRSTHGQPPVIWDRAKGFQVYDKYGNVFLDFSSGVLVANCGHSHPEVIKAVKTELDRELIFSYCFHNEARERLLNKLKEISPTALNKYYRRNTGEETKETGIKRERTWGLKNGGEKKHIIVSFVNSFHGRTMGAQQISGNPVAKEWIVNLDPGFVQVPFPDNVYCKDLSFEVFLNSLEQQNISPRNVAGVMVETYQGGIVAFAPKQYIQTLREWCDEHDVLLMFDEVQAGLGRCGRWWGFEHYEMIPDLVAAGKGIGGGMPISAVLGKKEIMEQYKPGSMTTTYGGNPVCCAAAAAAIEVIQNEKLVDNSERMGKILLNELENLKAIAPENIRTIQGKGLVAGIHMKKKNGDPDGELAHKIVWNCVQSGVLLFAPVGPGEATIKICPPLVINEEALKEGIAVITKAFKEEINE